MLIRDRNQLPILSLQQGHGQLNLPHLPRHPLYGNGVLNLKGSADNNGQTRSIVRQQALDRKTGAQGRRPNGRNKGTNRDTKIAQGDNHHKDNNQRLDHITHKAAQGGIQLLTQAQPGHRTPHHLGHIQAQQQHQQST